MVTLAFNSALGRQKQRQVGKVMESFRKHRHAGEGVSVGVGFKAV